MFRKHQERRRNETGHERYPADLTPTPGGEEVETEEETERWLDDVPETMDYGGRTLHFALYEGVDGNLTKQPIWVESDTGDVVDSAVFKRNIDICERFNIVIVEPLVGDGNESVIRMAVKAGSSEFDVYGGYQYYSIVLGSEGSLFDLGNKDRFPYFDFEREYWGTDYIMNMSPDEQRIFWASGDLALRFIGGMYVSYVNAAILANHYPDLNLYDVVDEGGWTLDYVRDITSTVYIDKNANGSRDGNDQYGFSVELADPIDGMAAGCMINFSERNDVGEIHVTLEHERTYTFWEKFGDLTWRSEGMIPNAGNQSILSFNEGNIFVTCNKLCMSGIYLREMEDDFLILPLPKLDENQPHYNTRIHDSCTLYGVPVTASDPEFVSAVLEALAAESFKTVSPAYYEIALKVKFARDSDSGRMIELVRQNVSSDFAALWSHRISDINHFFRQNYGNDAIASQIQRGLRPWDKGIEKLVAALMKLNV